MPITTGNKRRGAYLPTYLKHKVYLYANIETMKNMEYQGNYVIFCLKATSGRKKTNINSKCKASSDKGRVANYLLVSSSLKMNPSSCGLLCGLCSCGKTNTVDALEFYQEEERRLAEQVRLSSYLYQSAIFNNLH